MQKVEYDITYCSDSWHAGARMDCEDALKKGYRAMRRILSCDSSGGRRFEIVYATSGSTVNMHPSRCEFRVRTWYDESETIKSVTIELKNILNQLLEQDKTMKYELKMLS